MTGAGARAGKLFNARYSRGPRWIEEAPGRVNLIGDHTDYSGGLVLPAALTVTTAVACDMSQGGGTVLVSESMPNEAEFVPGRTGVKGWGSYAAGVAWALVEDGFEVPQLEVAIASDVPTGSGLSSSAALEVALARAWRAAGKLDVSDVQLALLCRKAENHYVGIPSGIMDQFAASVASPGQALLLDCQTLAYRTLPIPAGWSFVVVDSGESRHLTGTAYAHRVQECGQAAALCGLSSLRELAEGDLSGLRGVALKRARHVYTENRRVQLAARALEEADATAFGELMSQSHASLRDDFEVSSPALDALVEAAARFAGCMGSRLTGAGLGGCTVHLLDERTDRLAAAFARHVHGEVPNAKVVSVLRQVR